TGARSESAYRVALVVQAPGRVAHQAHGAVSLPARDTSRAFDRRAQSLGCLAREHREGPTHGVEDVGVRAAELRRPKPRVQPPSELVEDVEAGCGVLDLDGIEVELRRQHA